MIRLRVLGSLDLTDAEGQSVSEIIAQPKRTALLMYLVLTRAGGMHRRDSLLALFWPDSTEERARNSLSQSLSIFRKCTPGVLNTRGLDEVGVDRSAIECDVLRFEDAIAGGREAEALTLYSGDLLPGFNLSGLPEFERWLDSERLRLRSCATDAHLSLSKKALSAGDFAAAKRWAVGATALAPEDERVLRATLEVFDKSGDRSGAVRSYQDFARQLRTEYEIEPSPETKALVERIKSREAVALSPPTPATALPVASFPARPDAEAIAPRPVPRKPRRWPLALAIGIGTISSLGFMVAVSRRSSASELKPVLIAPFENRTGDESINTVGLMMADLIADGVVRARLAPVINLGGITVSHASGTTTQASVQEAARHAGAAVAVTGRIYAAGKDSLRYSAAITAVNSGIVIAEFGPFTQLRSEPIIAIKDIADRVVGALAQRYDRRLGDVMDSLQQPPKAAAYEHYIKGMKWFTQERNPDSALTQFRAAYTLDTAFVTARVWSIWALLYVHRYGEVKALVDSLQQRRNTLSPLNRNAVDAFRAYLAGNWGESISAAARAASIAPESEWAWNQAQWTLAVNRPHEAVLLFRKMDPFHGWLREWGSRYWGMLAWSHHVIGDFAAEARDWADAPRDEGINFTNVTGLGYASRGRYSDVEQFVARLAESDSASVVSIIAAVVDELVTHHPTDRDPAARQALDSIMRMYADWRGRRTAPLTENLLYRDAHIQSYIGRLKEADTELSMLVREHPDKLYYARELAVVVAREGDSLRARALLSGFAETPPRVDKPDIESVLIWQAQVEGRLGNRKLATELLAAAFRSGVPRINGRHSWAFAFPRLRGYKPFDELVRSY